MSKTKEIYRSKIHNKDKSHDVCIIQQSGVVRGTKLKMTYESYNAAEKFTGEIFTRGEWSFLFSMLDLGVEPERSSYNIWDNTKRAKRAEALIKRGTEYFELLMK